MGPKRRSRAEGKTTDGVEITIENAQDAQPNAKQRKEDYGAEMTIANAQHAITEQKQKRTRHMDNAETQEATWGAEHRKDGNRTGPRTARCAH